MGHESIVTDSVDAGPRDRRTAALALTLVGAASIAAGWLVYVKLVLLDQQPSWDEAIHVLQGALIAHDLGSGDLMGFLFDSYRQVYWPPMHSWLIGATFLVTGESLEAARAVSVVAFVLLAPTLFLIARVVEARHGVLAGSLAVALALTSPGLIELAAKAMLELPGLLALSCSLLVHCLLERNPSSPPRAYTLLGVCTVITYLIKTNYGILFIISLILTELIAADFRPRRLLTRQNLYAALPLAIFCVIWFAYPPKLISTWNGLVNQPWGGDEARGLRGLIFYPRVLFDQSGSWWMSILLWVGLASAWKIRDRPGIGLLMVMALILFIIGEFHHTKLYRHILPMFPSMFVLTGVAGARLWGWARGRDRMVRIATVAALVGVATLHSASLGRREWTLPNSRAGMDIVDYVSAQALEHSPTLVLGTRGWLEPPVLDWNLLEAGLLPVTASGSAMDPRQDRQLAGVIDRESVPEGVRTMARRLLNRYDAPSTARSLHVADRSSNENQAQFEEVLEATLRSDPPLAIIALIGTSDTTSHTLDFIAPGIARGGFRQVSVREFPLAGTRVVVYRRP